MAKKSNAANSAGNSKQRKRGNPDKLIPFQFKPGQSGNPSGRPKKSILDDAIAGLLEGEVALGVTGAEALARAILKHAAKGNAKMAQLAAERVNGKPAASIEMTINTDGDILANLLAARKRGGIAGHSGIAGA